MRTYSETEQLLLELVDQFGRIRKYHGLTPEELLVAFDKAMIKKLLDEEILEKVKLKALGQKVKGVRFTSEGLALWLLFKGDQECPTLMHEVEAVARDVYLLNRLSYTDEATSTDILLKHHSKESIKEAYALGMLAKIKLKRKNQDVIKGYVLTNTGYAYLRGNKLL